MTIFTVSSTAPQFRTATVLLKTLAAGGAIRSKFSALPREAGADLNVVALPRPTALHGQPLLPEMVCSFKEVSQ